MRSKKKKYYVYFPSAIQINGEVASMHVAKISVPEEFARARAEALRPLINMIDKLRRA